MKLGLVDCYNVAIQRGEKCFEAGMHEVSERRVVLRMGSNCHQVTRLRTRKLRPMTHILPG